MDIDNRIEWERKSLLEQIDLARRVLDGLEHDVKNNMTIPSLGALQFTGQQIDMKCATLALLIDIKRGR